MGFVGVGFWGGGLRVGGGSDFGYVVIWFLYSVDLGFEEIEGSKYLGLFF